MNWKKRKVSKYLFSYFIKAMDKEGVPYEFSEEENYYYVYCPVNNRFFNVLRDDALCLIEQENSVNPSIPVISYWRYKHGYIKNGPFFIYSKDIGKLKYLQN